MGTSTAIAVTVSLLSHEASRLVVILSGVLVGPTLLLAPIPETHMLGGAFLLLQLATLRYSLLSGSGSSFLISIVCGGLAGGMTLSNFLPATVVAAAGGKLWRMRFMSAGPIAALMILMSQFATFILMLALNQPDELAGRLDVLSWPSAATGMASLLFLVVSQFGVPVTSLAHQGRDLVVSGSPSISSLVAAGVWLASMVALYLRTNAIDRRILLACGFALFGLVAWHAAYDTDEAYMFSPAAWPYLFVPLLMAIESHSKLAAVVVGASAIQTIIGGLSLYRLLS